MVPRDSYPMTRAGYLKWREGLKHFHAEKAGEILREVGYPEEIIARVQSLNLKKNFPHDAEGRVLEDALCLVFLEHQFGDLASKTTEDKMINALQKAWKKMTPAAQAQALKLSYSPQQHALLAEKALRPAEPNTQAFPYRKRAPPVHGLKRKTASLRPAQSRPGTASLSSGKHCCATKADRPVSRGLAACSSIWSMLPLRNRARPERRLAVGLEYSQARVGPLGSRRR